MAKKLSRPVWGVEIVKAQTLEGLAPSRRRVAATGRTPQEQRGRGIPARVAAVVWRRPEPPRAMATEFFGRSHLIRKDARKPSQSHGDISARRFQKAEMRVRACEPGESMMVLGCQMRHGEAWRNGEFKGRAGGKRVRGQWKQRLPGSCVCLPVVEEHWHIGGDE